MKKIVGLLSILAKYYLTINYLTGRIQFLNILFCSRDIHLLKQANQG